MRILDKKMQEDVGGLELVKDIYTMGQLSAGGQSTVAAKQGSLVYFKEKLSQNQVIKKEKKKIKQTFYEKEDELDLDNTN